jgi:hypothetical protein
MVTRILLHSLVYIPLQFLFLQFLVFFKIHYRIEALVCQNISQVTVKCTSVNRDLTHATHIAGHRVVSVYFMRAEAKPLIFMT